MEISHISDYNGSLNIVIGQHMELKGNFLRSERHKFSFFFFFNNLTILLHFSILLIYCLFYLKLFPHIQNYFQLKYGWFVQEYSFFYQKTLSLGW